MEATQTSSTEMINLPPSARAALALGSTATEKELLALVEASKAITAVIDPAGREQAHRQGMVMRTRRTTIRKVGKEARDDATKFTKSVIEEENRLVGIIETEEARILGLRDEFDAKLAAERAERERKEAERKAALQAKVDAIRNIPLGMAGATSAQIATEIAALRDFAPADAEFFDYAAKATEAANAAIVALMALHDTVAAKESADAAAEAERVEAARVAAEQEVERQRLADIARQEAEIAAAARAEEHRLAAAALAEQQAAAAEQQRIFAEQQAAFAAQQRAAADQLAADRAALQAEADALAAAKARADAEKLAAKEEAAAVERAAAQAVIDAAAMAEAHAEALAFDAEYYGYELPGGQRYSRKSFRDDGVPWLLNEDGSRSVFCDVDEGYEEPGADITTITEVDQAGAVMAVEAVATFPNVIRVEAWETLRSAVFNALASEINGSEVMSAVNGFITEFEAAA